MEEKSNNFLESLIFPLIFVAVIWLIAIVELLFELDLYWLGVLPRSFTGLKGIFTSPLIHGGFSHLISNSVPFLVSGTIIMYFYKNVAFKSFSWMYVITGAMVWIFARNENIGNDVYHIGASGVVYAMVAFIFFSGMFVRNRLSIVLSLIMILLYSGMIQGILPNQEGISWESHLMGGLVGMIVAMFFRTEIKAGHVKEDWDGEKELVQDVKEHFLPRDIFDKTKFERQQQQQEEEKDINENA